jgi:hypothetical protein
MQLPVPAPEGVKTPPGVIVPPVALHVTALLNVPVPVTVAAHTEVCDVLMDAGTATTVIPFTVEGDCVIPILAEPEILVYPA